MKRVAILAALGLGLAGSVAGADRQAGQARAAAACAVCHGPQGLATMPNTPHLAGQPAGYLAEQLRQYRSGGRRHEMMSLVARDLGDREIEDLAAWYGSLQVQVLPPR